jgi:hypothetical protein
MLSTIHARPSGEEKTVPMEDDSGNIDAIVMDKVPVKILLSSKSSFL